MSTAKSPLKKAAPTSTPTWVTPTRPRRLTQEDAAALLGIDQSKVSRITRGQFRGVSEAKLLELVARLGHDVKIVVGPVRRRAGKIELQFA